MIGKVLRGQRPRGLLYYLFGPGRREEHPDPHIVAGWRDAAELESPLHPDGRRDFRQLAGLLNQPQAALGPRGLRQPVWHCVVRVAPGDRQLSDEEFFARVQEAGVLVRTPVEHPPSGPGHRIRRRTRRRYGPRRRTSVVRRRKARRRPEPAETPLPLGHLPRRNAPRCGSHRGRAERDLGARRPDRPGCPRSDPCSRFGRRSRVGQRRGLGGVRHLALRGRRPGQPGRAPGSRQPPTRFARIAQGKRKRGWPQDPCGAIMAWSSPASQEHRWTPPTSAARSSRSPGRPGWARTGRRGSCVTRSCRS